MIFCTRLLNVHCSPQLNLPAYNQYALVVSLKEIYIYIFFFLKRSDLGPRQKPLKNVCPHCQRLCWHSVGLVNNYADTRSAWSRLRSHYVAQHTTTLTHGKLFYFGKSKTYEKVAKYLTFAKIALPRNRWLCGHGTQGTIRVKKLLVSIYTLNSNNLTNEDLCI